MDDEDELHEALQLALQREWQSVVQSSAGGLVEHLVVQSELQLVVQLASAVAKGVGGADVTVALFEPRPADYYDPPAAVCESMMSSDINVLVASTGMLHSPANFREICFATAFI